MRKVKVYKDVGKKEFDYIGTFHEFGKDFKEFNTSACEFSVAIVETSSGEIKTVELGYIKFIYEPNIINSIPVPAPPPKRIIGEDVILPKKITNFIDRFIQKI
jgi:hypothetical protein